MWCVEGEIFFINKLTGNKFKKGRLSGPQKKVVMNNKKQDKKSKNKKDTKDTKDTKEKDKKDMKQSATNSVNTSSVTASTTSSSASTTTLKAEAESSNVGNNRPKVDQGLLSDGEDEDNSDLEMTNEVTDNNSAAKEDNTDTVIDTSVHDDSNDEADSFSVEYVTSILEDKIPKVKVLQCWPQFKICFIQLVSISHGISTG